MNYPIHGECQCGQVTYALFEAPSRVIACHCTECQKLSTSPFSVTALVDAEKITFTGELKEWQRTAESGNTNCAKFCPNCGNRVYHYNPESPSKVKLKLKPVNLENSEIFQPTMHIWVSEKVSWYDVPFGMKTFAKHPVSE